MKPITYGAAVEEAIAGECSLHDLLEAAEYWDELDSRSLTNLLLARIAGSLAQLVKVVDPQLKLEEATVDHP